MLVRSYLTVSVMVMMVECQPVGHHQPSPLSHSVSRLSANLLRSINETESPLKNVIISPVSIFLALSLLYHGSDLSTRTELKNFLELNTQTDTGLSTKALLRDYVESKGELNTTIHLANIIFADDSLKIKKPYEQVLDAKLKSGVEKVDFSKPIPTAQVINNWVEQKTNNLITDFLSADSISETTRVVLLNAIYFKANWKYPFHEFETLKSVKFDVTPDSDVEVDMMFKSDDILYQSNPTLQSHVVSLPYEDENFQMMLFLPQDREENSLLSIIQQFSNTDFNQIYGNLKTETVDLYLPKFTISFKSELVTPLLRNGVKSMFNPDEADFSRISDEPLSVSNILHETKVEVTEEGSEAAGITGAILDLRTVIRDTPTVRLNRPFIFVIHDRKNNIPLFVGKVVNPSSAKPREKTDKTQNAISVRASNLDAEDLAHFNARPEDFLQVKNCSKVEYANTEKVFFPCGAEDTKPIEDYKREHGDASLLGINGEQAALLELLINDE